MLARRGFLTGMFSAFAAPAIVRAANIMPVKALPFDLYGRSPGLAALEDTRLLQHFTIVYRGRDQLQRFVSGSESVRVPAGSVIERIEYGMPLASYGPVDLSIG